MITKVKVLILFVTLLWSNVTVNAQDIRFERIGMADGLSFIGTRDIVQDKLGFLWVSTTRGLNRYDGYTFKTYWHDPNDSTSLSDDRTYGLLVDSRGDLWIGTNAGLNRYNRVSDSFTRFNYVEADDTSLASDVINMLYEDSFGWIWLGTNGGGLSRFDPRTETFKNYKPDSDNPDSISSYVINAVYEDREGVLWVGTTIGLDRFDRETGTFEHVEHIHQDGKIVQHHGIMALLEDNEGNFWVGTDGVNGIHVLDREENVFTEFVYDPDQPEALGQPPLKHAGIRYPFMYRVNTILQDKLGYIWFGVLQGGVIRYDPQTEKIEHYEYDPDDLNSLTGNWPWRIYEDNAGTIWIASDERGISKVVPNKFQQIQSQASSASNNVQSIYEGINEVWVGTLDGLSRIDSVAHTITPVLINTRQAVREPIKAVLEDNYGHVWVGTDRGVARVDVASGSVDWFIHDPDDPNSITAGVVESFYKDISGQIWIAVGTKLNKFNEEDQHFTKVSVPFDSAGTQHNIKALIGDRLDKVWVLWQHGIVKLDPINSAWGEIYNIYPFSTLALEDRDGRIWIGSMPNGLQLVNKTARMVEHFRTASGQVSGNVMGMLEDDQGMFWISDPSSLIRFDPYNETITRFSEEDGIPNAGYNPRSYHKGKSGRFYFGGSKGITVFDPQDLAGKSAAPKLAFTELLVDNKPVEIGENAPLSQDISLVNVINLKHDQTDFSISFSAFDYRKPQNNAYRYKLEGYDTEWKGPASNRQAIYTSIDSGTYVFRVIAANADGVWNEEGISIEINIETPWWKTRRAYAVYGLLFLSAVVLANLFQRNRLRQKERAQAELQRSQLKAESAAERAKMAEHLEEVKTRFFVNISHEFRTPLTLLLGPVRDALQGMYGRVGGPLRAQLESMHRNADRLHQLINQLLDLAKLEAGGLSLQARQGDVVALSRAITLSFASRAEREQKALKFESAEAFCTIYFDREKLEKVLINLLSNAFKFTRANDKITVIIKKAGGAVRIKVVDTGKGISEAERLHIFDRFHQVDTSLTRRQEGSGIGLALAKELVELHQGRISVESTQGIGSTFTISMPVGRAHLRDEDLVIDEDPELLADITHPFSSEAQEGLQDELEEIKGSKAESVTILIVEDNQDVRNYIKSHLGKYKVEEAEDGVQGLEKALAVNPDLVICDVMMPVMDGYALCAALKHNKHTQDIPVILLTAKAAEEDKVEGLEVGADDYLYKPFSARELLVRTENLISQRRRLQAQYRSEVVLKPSEVVVSSTDAVFMEKITAIVETQLGDTHFGVERLANEIGLSRRQLQRRLNKVVHMTPTAFIRDIRLERASYLLEKQAGNISEISFKVGYEDPRYFSRLFKEKYGFLPSQFEGGKPGNK